MLRSLALPLAASAMLIAFYMVSSAIGQSSIGFVVLAAVIGGFAVLDVVSKLTSGQKETVVKNTGMASIVPASCALEQK